LNLLCAFSTHFRVCTENYRGSSGEERNAM
jgi:hypothetical protein